ncbi:MAG: DNA/RNA non-specific endonuclease, partial [Bacteroidota bacterium]|nr:DNA/RNA non-specific endonuclease [Bacteroidota bacterium]
MKIWIQVFFFLLFAVAVQAQDYHVVASRNAIVRTAPDGEAEMILRMEAGDELNTVTIAQTNAHYHVQLDGGRTGWVSRYVVRLVHGAADDPLLPADSGEGTLHHLEIGEPVSFVVLRRRGYVVGYDTRLRIPVWVQYRMTRISSLDDSFERTDSFDDDTAVHVDGRAYNGDYNVVGDGYARGHLAPADDMLWSAEAERESNLLTNVAPQIGGGYNSSVWLRVEKAVRDFAERRGDVTVITGPVFTVREFEDPVLNQPETPRQVLYNVLGENNVAVPTAFFKVVVDM